jgi:hypothetical protein
MRWSTRRARAGASAGASAGGHRSRHRSPGSGKMQKPRMPAVIKARRDAPRPHPSRGS